MNCRGTIFFLALFFASVSAVCQGEIKSAGLTAGGVTCSLCSKAIYKALTKVATVADVQADIQHSKYLIRFKDHAKVDLDQLKKAVQDAGFSIASLEVTALFDHVEIDNNSQVDLSNLHLQFLKVKKQLLNGERKVVVIDKSFITGKEFTRYKAYLPSAEDNSSLTEPFRIYHVTLL